MKRIGLALALSATVIVCVSARAALAQVKPLVGYSKVYPLRTVDSRAIRSSVMASTTIPMFQYSVVSHVDGLTYQGSMVGRSPFFHGARTTNIKTILVPLIVKMSDGGVFDPTKADPTCSPGGVPNTLVRNSPIFFTHDYVMDGIDVGTAQYIDAFQRASFWTNVSVTGARYHNVLSPVTIATAVTYSPVAGKGATYPPSAFGGSPCTALGVLDTDALDAFLQNTAIPGLAAQGVNPKTLPIFIVYNVVQAVGGDNPFTDPCCILGFHNSTGFPPQTYSITDFDTTGLFPDAPDVAILAHEIGEWMDDPLGGNPVPLWGHIGQQSSCQGNLEVGDPLSGTDFPAVSLNGFTYHMQELAYFSWFYRQSPSLGTDGDFSNNETFETDAGPVCS